ncbi:HNH endonuclease [Oligoflexia bacterium]|nr:HNH endonuclease [Oligoflexia bacterium]
MVSVLLLNASYEPLRVISWQRAVSMFFLGKVEVVEEYDHDIRSVSLVIKAPAVVRLLQYVRLRHSVPSFSRANILARDNFQCQYCRIKLSSREATLDHVIPRSKGGRADWGNIVCCCKTCNRKKGAKTPRQAGLKLLKKPIKPQWLPVLQIRFHEQPPKSWHSFLRVFKK